MRSTSSEILASPVPEDLRSSPPTIASVAFAAIESLRPHQWLKNLLVLVPLAAAHRIADWSLLLPAMRTFVAFSLCASAVYLANDLHDLAADRDHPHKRFRAIASGRLPPRIAAALIPILLIGVGLLGSSLGIRVCVVLALYLGLMVAYTWRLKAVILLDAFVLASGYALRVLAGSLAIDIRPSARLLAFCIFLFVSLALIKRYAEVTLLGAHDGQSARARGYRPEDQTFILALGVACGALSVLVLALYMSSGEIERSYSHAQFIWLTCVMLLYWISYLWLMAHRGRMTDDPLVFAVRDRASLVLIVLMGATAWLAV